MPATVEAPEVEDIFALDVVVISDPTAGEATRGCATDDGCSPTCASACVSIGETS